MTKYKEKPRNCEGCFRWDFVKCKSFTKPYQTNCPAKVTDKNIYLLELEKLMEVNKGNTTFYYELKDEYEELAPKKPTSKEIKEVYEEEKRRGAGGSKSEGGGRENKSILNDNRAKECKDMTKQERAEYKETLEKWECENGALDKHKSIGYGMSRSKVDSYTGEDIP